MRLRSLVLCYHAVTDCWDDPLAIPAATIERQVRMLLRRGYRPVDAVSALTDERLTLHVTFDDAFRNVAGVLPALQRLGVGVTIFACTRFAEDGRPFHVSELRGRAPAREDELLTMPWDTLRELARQGVEIGSHTVSHPHLTWLSDRDLRAELVDSKRRIADELGRECRVLAYPYGDDDDRVRAATRAAGYEAAFSLGGRAGELDRFSLPRVDVYRGDGRVRFALKVSPLRGAASTVRGALSAS